MVIQQGTYTRFNIHLYDIVIYRKFNCFYFYSGTTLLLELDDIASMEILYKPGDHLGVFACNRSEFVEEILKRIQTPFDPDVSIELQMQKQSHTPNGLHKYH